MSSSPALQVPETPLLLLLLLWCRDDPVVDVCAPQQERPVASFPVDWAGSDASNVVRTNSAYVCCTRINERHSYEYMYELLKVCGL